MTCREGEGGCSVFVVAYDLLSKRGNLQRTINKICTFLFSPPSIAPLHFTFPSLRRRRACPTSNVLNNAKMNDAIERTDTRSIMCNEFTRGITQSHLHSVHDIISEFYQVSVMQREELVACPDSSLKSPSSSLEGAVSSSSLLHMPSVASSVSD
jgi:hypothetical protein